MNENYLPQELDEILGDGPQGFGSVEARLRENTLYSMELKQQAVLLGYVALTSLYLYSTVIQEFIN